MGNKCNWPDVSAGYVTTVTPAVAAAGVDAADGAADTAAVNICTRY
jgi:hypothetical protein